MTRKGIVFSFAVLLLVLIISHGTLWARQSRLSAAVALISTGSAIDEFLVNPGVSYVQAYVRFDPDFPDDVIIALDQEFIEGVNAPLFFQGGDWMSFVGVQRNGAVWVAVGTDDTMAGVPSKERTWKILDLNTRLEPNTWYKLRVEANFGTRHYISFSISGKSLERSFDLTEHKLDFPNVMPFDNRSMSYYVVAMRSRDMMKTKGKPIVYFDDVEGGVAVANRQWQTVFADGFETQQSIGAQPVTLPVIRLEGYRQKYWYLERDEALISVEQRPFARSGNSVGVASAALD